MPGTGLYAIGMWLIVTTAGLFLLLTLVVVRYLPRFVLPGLIVSWTLGILGFVLVCVDTPTVSNIVLGVLFVLAGAVHGMRLRRRAERIAEARDAFEEQTDAE